MSDYFLAMSGGLLISLATSTNLLIKGRLSGLSGILFSIISLDRETFNWKFPFMMSFIFFGSLARFFMSFDGQNQFFVAPQELVFGLSKIGFLVGGLCVGLGTKLANGCTSGHGVCGLPRFAVRSWVSVPTFLVTAVIVANIKTLFGLFSDRNYLENIYLMPSVFEHPSVHWLIMGVCGTLLVFFTIHKFQQHNHKALENVAIGSLVGMIFSIGLIVSGMVDRFKILNFLVYSEKWDPSMLIVLMTAVGLNMLTFNAIMSLDAPIHAKTWDFTPSSKIDWRLVIGSILFGIGWGITGLCPGPSILLLQFGTIKITGYYFAGVIVGQLAAYFGEKQISHILRDIQRRSHDKQADQVRVSKATTATPVNSSNQSGHGINNRGDSSIGRQESS
jgi:uncharacterized membrane protein YedE/YeeE